MFKELDNIVSKEIMKAMELDLEEINLEEYEEIHYIPSLKVSNRIKVKKATREELDRINKLLTKKYSRKSSQELNDYFEVKETMQEEEEKRYRPTKTKVYNDTKPEDFEDKMIYTLRYIISYDDNSRFIDILNYLRKSYKNYEYMILEDKVKRIRKIFIIEENTYEKDLSTFTSRQLKDYKDKLEILLNTNIEKIVFTDRVLKNTFVIKDSFEKMLSSNCPILPLLQEYYLNNI